MIVMESNWDIPEIVNKVPTRSTSRVYYDDIENPVSPRDRKNMTIMDNTRVEDKEDGN